jgi:hypothetical protein
MVGPANLGNVEYAAVSVPRKVGGSRQLMEVRHPNSPGQADFGTVTRQPPLRAGWSHVGHTTARRWMTTSVRGEQDRRRVAANTSRMGIATRKTIDEADLERSQLRQGVDGREAEQRRCDGCGRTPLIGESVATYADGAVRCDLCRSMHRGDLPVSEALVKHAPDGPRSRVRVIRRLPV